MDEMDKAVIRVHHWVSHGQDHIDDYRRMAEFLTQAGRPEAAAELFRVVELEERAAGHMKRAAELLGEPKVVAGHDHGHGHGHSHDH